MKESAIVKQIMDWLNAEHIFNFRLGTGTFFGEHKGKAWAFRAHSLGPGAADILAFTDPADDANGTHVQWFVPTWIECKNENGKQSPGQISFQQYVEGLGHRYILARSFEDVATKIRSVK